MVLKNGIIFWIGSLKKFVFIGDLFYIKWCLIIIIYGLFEYKNYVI